MAAARVTASTESRLQADSGLAFLANDRTLAASRATSDCYSLSPSDRPKNNVDDAIHMAAFSAPLPTPPLNSFRGVADPGTCPG